MTAAAHLLDDATPIPDAGAAVDGLRWAAVVMGVTPLFLLAFNAASLKTWASQLAPSPATVVIRDYADRWYDTTERLGLSAPRDAMHGAWNKAVAAKWGGGARAGNSANP